MKERKILVVDDEPFIVELVEINLIKAGYKVITAYDGEEALKKVEEEKPDLIICDVNMPKLDGFEVLKRLKSNMATRYIPVVMLTARAGDEDVFKGWHLKVDQYLTKPFNPQQVLVVVKNIFKAMEDEIKERMKDKYIIS
jgi:DNA-binding response OmpR family regulator